VKTTDRNSGSQDHVDCCWFDKDDNGIKGGGVESLDGIATHVKDTVLALHTAHDIISSSYSEYSLKLHSLHLTASEVPVLNISSTSAGRASSL